MSAVRTVRYAETGGPHRLGRHVRHDPRSRRYRLRGDGTAKTVQWERHGPILDQGDLGSCTGNAGTGLLSTGPFAGTVPVDQLTEAYAVALYSDATKVDDAPGSYPPRDTGSDGLAIATVLKARGLISGYRHAFGLGDALTAIQAGPLLVGSVWTDSMFDPDPDGVVTATGPVAGGHEYECVGYDATADLWRFANSWGTGWGVGGYFAMTSGTFAALLAQQGDIVAPVPATAPTPTPAPAPAVPSAADVALRDALPDQWTTKRHHGDNAAAATAVAAWEAATFG